ncbi:uncharacterized protein LOC126738589 isoform X2 [Anthonomus grandis grandis]|uniref:uncharacterized protein LOC126738589 isoform X2 n=1 Tax=Anthonomus grandis grandis TaxID=2921223 RepID=UPI0021666188|nr:uncharacterized protein LOC126738589 isoform X2 [Anthonomus grandis grandis]
MRHRHRWPYILLVLPLWLFLPTLLATPNPSPSPRTRHQPQRQIHRLVGGYIRTLDRDQDDTELITASAGGNTKNQKGGKSQGDDRKTLSQQVADGKYGLIQKELFRKPPKRPGILSYDANPEVPHDNIATLGGLTKNDIWLAENHLLVIKGGTYPPHDDTKQDLAPVWQPIDDYSAPLHQVKIPKNPAVPPPFPVQLSDDGPLQILGTNSSRTLNASAETPAYALPPPPGWDGEIPPQAQYFPTETNMNETHADILDEDDPSIYYPPPYSFYYPKDNSSAVPPGPLVPGIILPPPPKFFGPLEDTTTTTTIRYHPKTRPTYTTKHTTTEPTISNEISTSKPYKTVPTRVTVVKNYSKVTTRVHRPRKRPVQTTKLVKTTTGKPKLITILPVHVNKLNRTYLPANSVKRKPPVTILKPVKPETATPKTYGHPNELADRPYISGEAGQYKLRPKEVASWAPQRENYGRLRPGPEQRPVVYEREKNRYEGSVVSTTQVPLKYYTTANQVEVNSVTPLPEKYSIGINANQYQQQPAQRPQRPANYYYYEETDPALNTITTEKPFVKPNYYPNQYYIPVKPTVAPPRTPSVKPQYIYLTGRPYVTEHSHPPKLTYVQPQKQQGTFSLHIAKLQNQISQHYSTPVPELYHRPTPKPVYQYSFQAQNYHQRPVAFKPSPLMDDNEDSFKPIPQYSVEVQPAIEIVPTERPSYQQVQPLNVEEPSYFSTERPRQQYLQEIQQPPAPRRPPAPSYGHNIEVTSSRPIAEFSFDATPNPIHQGYYTKPDEDYFDKNTKQYFTIFGRKLPSSTTPIPSVTRAPSYNRQPPRPKYRQPSLQSDINVNYAKQRPPVNPLSEPIRGQYYEDVSANPEIVKAIEITPPPIDGRGNKERYIHYSLPGDEGAHFYFLTPQGVDRRRREYFIERRQVEKSIQEKKDS